jgi:hypothetical protein
VSAQARNSALVKALKTRNRSGSCALVNIQDRRLPGEDGYVIHTWGTYGPGPESPGSIGPRLLCPITAAAFLRYRPTSLWLLRANGAAGKGPGELMGPRTCCLHGFEENPRLFGSGSAEKELRRCFPLVYSGNLDSTRFPNSFQFYSCTRNRAAILLIIIILITNLI